MIGVPDGAGEALHVLARLVAHYVLEGQRAQHAGMVDQSASPLGARNHIALVRRLATTGDPGAAIVGRRFLARPEIVAAELAAISKRAKKSKEPKPRSGDALAALRERHGLELVS